MKLLSKQNFLIIKLNLNDFHETYINIRFLYQETTPILVILQILGFRLG